MPRQSRIRFGVGHAQPHPGGTCANEKSDNQPAGRGQRRAMVLSSVLRWHVNVLCMAAGIINAENGNLPGGIETFAIISVSEKAVFTLQVSFDR
jgi:hypothetical protein